MVFIIKGRSKGINHHHWLNGRTFVSLQNSTELLIYKMDWEALSGWKWTVTEDQMETAISNGNTT